MSDPRSDFDPSFFSGGNPLAPSEDDTAPEEPTTDDAEVDKTDKTSEEEAPKTRLGKSLAWVTANKKRKLLFFGLPAALVFALFLNKCTFVGEESSPGTAQEQIGPKAPNAKKGAAPEKTGNKLTFDAPEESGTFSLVLNGNNEVVAIERTLAPGTVSMYITIGTGDAPSGDFSGANAQECGENRCDVKSTPLCDMWTHAVANLEDPNDDSALLNREQSWSVSDYQGKC